MTEMLLLLFRLLSITLLSSRVFGFFLSKLRGAPKIDLPLSIFSLVVTVLASLLFSEEVILEEEKKDYCDCSRCECL